MSDADAVVPAAPVDTESWAVGAAAAVVLLPAAGCDGSGLLSAVSYWEFVDAFAQTRFQNYPCAKHFVHLACGVRTDLRRWDVDSFTDLLVGF